MREEVVAIAKCRGTKEYPKQPPFHPDTPYPEYPWPDLLATEPNSSYHAVREALHLLGLDDEHFGTPRWNPLGGIIAPGETVFVKPNMIRQTHEYTSEWRHVITHGAVIRAVLDYVYIALRARGTIILGDGPQTDSLFGQIIEQMGIPQMQDLFRGSGGCQLEVVDLRDAHWVERDGIYVDTVTLSGDPLGKTSVNLGANSMFNECDGQGKVYYGAHYNSRETNDHHSQGRHEYAVCRSPITADVFINIPKLKTHKKCGITVNMKSLVGINANKNWLPHYSFGSPETGGDQFDRRTRSNTLENRIVRAAKRRLASGGKLTRFLSRKTKRAAYRIFGKTDEVVRSGNWWGNDTVWRMCLDLVRILLYASADGAIPTQLIPKRYFSVVDGILSMEGNGPISGSPKETGVILAGANPVAVDAACATLMGFDLRKLPIISRAFEKHPLPLVSFGADEVAGRSNEPAWNGPIRDWRRDALFRFEPHFAWRGHIEAAEEPPSGGLGSERTPAAARGKI